MAHPLYSEIAGTPSAQPAWPTVRAWDKATPIMRNMRMFYSGVHRSRLVPFTVGKSSKRAKFSRSSRPIFTVVGQHRYGHFHNLRRFDGEDAVRLVAQAGLAAAVKPMFRL